MHVVGVVGSHADDVARRLSRTLRDRGRVALVRRDDASADGGLLSEADVDSSYVLGDDGARLERSSRTLTSALDDLAPDHDYAVVSGYPEASIPTVAVADATPDCEVIARIARDSQELDPVVDAIHDAEPHETLQSLIDRAKAAPGADRAGAIATFTGRVRAHDDPDDPETTRLEFETYQGVAEERMAEIEAELEAQDGVFEVVLHHRTGVIEAGEDIVFVVVLAGHRPEAFATVEDGIERLKAEVPIFKKEVTVDGEFWAHERE